MSVAPSFPLVLSLVAFGGCGPERDPNPHGVVLGTHSTTTDTHPVTGTSSPTAPPAGGNVLLLVADDVGVDKIAAYGITSANVQTPNLDLLIAAGMRFTNAWALPSGGATLAAIETGRYGRRTGLGGDIATDSQDAELDPGQLTLAEAVAASPAYAYTTAYVGRWGLSTYLSPSGTAGPLVQGWGSYAGPLGNLSVWSGGNPPEEPGYYFWKKVAESGQVETRTLYATTDVVDEAIDRLLTMPEPWVLQVSFNAAQEPYDLPPDELLTSEVGTDPDDRVRQRLIVEALDAELGRLFSSVPVEQRDHTTLIFLGDNGTAGAVAEDEIDPARAAGGVYEPSIRVPLIVSGPLVAVPGSVSEALVHVVDVLPTLAEIVGTDLTTFTAVLDPLAQRSFDGESLLPLLADPQRAASRDVSYTERFSPIGPPPYDLDIRAVRDARYKLVFDAVANVEQFFECPHDATDEGRNLLPCNLTEQQQAAYENLHTQLVLLTRSMSLDAVWEAGGAVPDLGAPTEPLLDLPCE